MTPSQIQALRKKLGMSKIKFGEACGVTRQAVHDWEAGNNVPSRTALILMQLLEENHDRSGKHSAGSG